MGAASSKHDGCLICLFGDGYADDAGRKQSQLHVSEQQRRMRALEHVSCHGPFEEDVCQANGFQAGSAAGDNRCIRARGEVRRVGSLQEEIDWIEREAIYLGRQQSHRYSVPRVSGIMLCPKALLKL